MTDEDFEKIIAEEEAAIAEIKEHYEKLFAELKQKRKEEIAMHQKTVTRLKGRNRKKYFQGYYQHRRKYGLCTSCGAPSGKYAHCEACRERDRDRAREARKRGAA